MEGKRVEKIVKITIFIVCILFLLMILMPAFQKTRRYPNSNYLAHYMQIMSQSLTQYYNENNLKDEIKVSDVVHFLANDCDFFSRYAFTEVQKQQPLRCYPIYFCLPEKLKSDFPTIIAYSGPIQDYNKKMYRVVLILNGNNMSSITIENHKFEKVLSNDQLEVTRNADLYIQLPPRR